MTTSHCVLNSKAEYLLVKIQQIAQLAMNHGHEEIKDGELYNELVDQIFSTQLHVNQANNALQKLAGATSVEDFNKLYKKEVSAKTPALVKITEYNAAISKINSVLMEQQPATNTVHNVDNECLEVASEISTIDPITKRRMENPVKNRNCKHSYEKSSILELMKQNPRLRCPVPGCSNRNFIKADDLEDDPELFRILAHNPLL